MHTIIRAILFAVVFLFLFSCSKPKSLSKAQDTVIHYLYQPALISDTFCKVLWHTDIDFRGLDPEKGDLYFIAKKNLPKHEMFTLLAIDSTLVEFAPCDTGICEFGGMKGRIDGYYAFRLPATNLKVDTTKVFKYRYYGNTMPITFRELMQNMDSMNFYHTPTDVDLSPFFRQTTYAANIASYISLKDRDPVVKALAEKITTGLKTPEQKAQALLNYVGSQVDYSFEDRWYETEVCKRAHEVLLSGDGDCSGKSTLYASLLEQCDIPYVLLYFDNHINVGLRGNYPGTNGYHTTIKDIKYVMAETTLDSFIIGKTRLSNDEIISKVLFYQDPHASPYIFDAKTGRQFEFVKTELLE